MVKMAAVWDRTAEFLGDNLAAVMPVALLAVFTPMCVLFNMGPLLRESEGAGALVLGLVTLLCGLAIRVGLLAIATMATDSTATREAAIGHALRRLPLMIGLMLLYLLALWLLALPLFALVQATGLADAMSGGGEARLTPGGSLAIALGLLVYAVAAAWLGVRIGVLSQPVVVAERAGLGTIRRAWRLTRGLAPAIFGVLMLYYVVSLVAVLAAQTVFGSILHLFADNAGPISVASVIASVAAAAVAAGFTVLANAFTAKLYIAARAEQERAVTS